MNQTIIVLIGVVASIFLGALSNWIYDLLKGTIFTDKPRVKHILVATVSALPFLILVVLSQISPSENLDEQQNISSLDIGGDVSDTAIIQSDGGDVNIVQPASPPEIITADQVLQCMKRHNMQSAENELYDENTDERTKTFQFCDWPPQPYADPDGYSEIIVRTVATKDNRPGRAEQVAPFADRIKANCSNLILSYSLGVQMMYGFLPEFEIPLGTIEHLNNIVGEGSPPIRNDRDGNSIYDGLFLGFYPERNEIVVLHLDVHSLDRAECVKTE